MSESGVPYEERELIRRAVNGASSRHKSNCVVGIAAPRTRSAIVKSLFCCGSTVAERICYRYGYDPERMIGRQEPA